MRARYLGDHENMVAWGIRFPRNVFVPVTDPHAQHKIEGNSHFEVENSDAEYVEFREVPVVAPVEQPPVPDAEPVIAPPVVAPQQTYAGAKRGPKPKHK